MSASRTTGTSSVRLPSLFSRSTAMPRLTCSWRTTRGLPSASSDVAGVHDRHRLVDRPHDREPDEVGEGHLAAAGAAEVAVDHPPVDLEELGRDAPEAGGGGDLEAGLHVGDDAGGRPADRLADRLGGRRRRRRRPGSARGGAAAARAGAGGGDGRRRPPSSGGRRRAGSRRRSPASSRSPTWGRRGTARASRRRARRWDRARSGRRSSWGESSATAPSVPARASTTRRRAAR